MNTFHKLINRNKFIAITICLLTFGMLYGLFAHQVIESVYQGESFFLLNKLFKIRGDKSLDYYVKKVDMLYVSLNILFVCFVFGISFAYKLWRRNQNILELIGKEVQKLTIYFIENKKITLIWLAIFIGFGLTYLYIGFLLTSGYEKFNFFGADHWEPSLCWTDPKQRGCHKGSHPLLLLLIVPLGNLLHSLTTATLASVLALNALFGATAVTLAAVFFWNFTTRYIDTLLLTFVFGLSMSQLFFSSLPETYALASLTIVATYVLFLACLQNQKLYLGYWILVGILTFGVTITNFAQTLICFVATVFILKQRHKVVSILEYIGNIVSSAFLLSILQRLLFTQAKFFFLPSTFKGESNYIEATILNNPFLVMQEVIKHFFLVNFIAPSPFAGIDYENPSRLLLGFFMRPLDYSFLGYMGMFLWLSLFVIGFSKNIFFTQKPNIYIIAIALGVIFNMVLFSCFEVRSMFLFTCNFTFPVLLLAINKSLLEKTYFKICLTVLIVLMGINNLSLIEQIIYT